MIWLLAAIGSLAVPSATQTSDSVVVALYGHSTQVIFFTSDLNLARSFLGHAARIGDVDLSVPPSMAAADVQMLASVGVAAAGPTTVSVHASNELSNVRIGIYLAESDLPGVMGSTGLIEATLRVDGRVEAEEVFRTQTILQRIGINRIVASDGP